MPEVCEVALTAQILNKYLKGKIISSFYFITGRFGPGRVKPDGYKKFRTQLPLKIISIDSKGKFMWFDLVNLNDNTKHWYIWNTFGMTGMWSFKEQKSTRAILMFENSKKILYYSDSRNFGTFKFSQDDAELDKKLLKLSPDFLKDEFDISNITKYKQNIVAILMNQTKLGSGIGNYLVAEILYHANISPHRSGDSLTDDEVDRLTFSIKYMVKLCYVTGATGYMKHVQNELDKIEKINYHPDIKITSKDKKFLFTVYGQKEDPYGNMVEAEKIIKGRSTYWVPAVQK